MQKTKFITELKFDINRMDFTFLRLLYLPLIGPKAVMLFELLNDYNYLHRHHALYNDFEELTTILDCTHDELLLVRQKLEAVGLLRVFVKADEKHFIFAINKPLAPRAFKKNTLLYEATLAKKGQNAFEKAHFMQNHQSWDKKDFQDVTTKYQNLFAIPKKAALKTTQLMTTPASQSIDDAIKSLNSEQFINFLTKKNLSPSQLGAIQRAYGLNFTDIAINEIVRYSYDTNNKVVIAQHINKIIEDLYAKKITYASQIKIELAKAMAHHNKFEAKESNFSENQPQMDKSWDDLFKAIGGI